MKWVAALLLAASATGANAYDRLYVFGDSLVDSGNAQKISPSRVPSSVYPSGRFTNGANGRNFADYFSRLLGFGDTSPAVTSAGPPVTFGSGTNFAVGGATTVPNATTSSLPFQISGVAGSPGTYPYNYAAAVSAGITTPIDSNSLVLIATGGNDIRGFTPNFSAADLGVGAFVTSVNTALRSSLDDLFTRGARNFVLVGVPNVGLIPEVNGNPVLAAQAAALSMQINTTYQAISNDYSARLGSAGVFQLFDLAGLQSRLTLTPTAYGLDVDKVGKSCVRDGGAAALATNCAGYAYYDTIHPTDAANRIIGNAIFANLASAVPEPESWVMLIVGFGVVGGSLRSGRRRAALAAA